MTTEYQLTLQDYLSIIRRRAPYLLGIFVLGLIISITTAIVTPSVYRATGTILVESTQIPDNVVSSAIKIQLDEQINMIGQRVMTRENMLHIANKYNLLMGNMGSMTSSELASKVRDRITIVSGGPNESIRPSLQGQQAIAFTLSFDDSKPDTALQVTNDLLSLFLDWNVKLRNESASDTTAFLTQESDKLKIEVDRLENLIAEFKQQNKNALPEQLTLRMSMLSRAENDLREVERDIRSIKEEIRTLEVELAAARHGTSENDQSQTLPALKAELARLSVIYKESHPDIKRLKYKIEAMEKVDSTAATEPASSDTLNPATYKIRAKINSNIARLASLAQQKEMLQGRIAENDRAMIQTPKVAQELDVLIRDRDIALKKFEEFRSKRMNAKIAENLESENKSGNFSVLEPPQLPEKPFKPNRLKIVLLGCLVSLVLALGAAFTLESIDKRVRGIDAITHVLGFRPLACIPYIPGQEDKIGMKNKFMNLLARLR
jgi:polysaccharide chain length determinant protein (PEP-CTERM system associated)